MADITWIKLRTNMFDDEKIKLIERMPEGDSILITWVKLLAYAGKVNCNGYIMINENIPMNIEQVAIIFNKPFEKVKYAISVLSNFGMLDVTENEVIAITNWNKHQNIEGMDKIRLQNRERKRKQREKQKTLMLEECHVTVTGSHATDIEKEKEKEKESNTPKEVKDSNTNNTVSQIAELLKTKQYAPRFVKLTDKRKSAILARIKEHGLDTVIQGINMIDECEQFIDAINEKKSWYNIDFIFNENKFVKLLEGAYLKRIVKSGYQHNQQQVTPAPQKVFDPNSLFD